MPDAQRKIAIVTGANQGLGLALVRGLCRTLETGSTVYLAARDIGRGRRRARCCGGRAFVPP
jgi:NAD(P)-dependent dehydrogenase (short-subunit alcohol dehydrogenase family)